MNTQFSCYIQVGCIMMLSLIQATAKAADSTVVAGKRVGRVHLGFTRAQVHKALGKPDRTFDFRKGLTGDLWRANNTGLDQNGNAVQHKIEVIYKAGKAVQIEVTSPVFTTASGLSTKSNLRKLNSSLYPKRYFTYSYGDGKESSYLKYYLDQVQSGIAFESPHYQDNWFWDRGSETIIVHKKGVPVIPDQGGKFVSSQAYVPDENSNQ